MTDGRVLLVGESNPYGADPQFALYCSPPNSAGARLRRILGLSEDAYLGMHRVNLCVGAWDKRQAKLRSHELRSPDSPWNVLVLLGRKVTLAFGEDGYSPPLLPFTTRLSCPGMLLVSLPHPSGRCTAWNAPGAVDRARSILREAVPEVAWGSEVAA